MRRIAVAALTVVVAAAGLTCGGTSGREDLLAVGGSEIDGSATNEGGVADATLVESGTDAVPPESGADATLADSGADATLADDSASNGAFDVEIMYADRVLPDVVAPPGASDGGDAGYPWPNCPPFVPVIRGRPVPAGQETDEVPAAYDDDGQVLLDDAGRVVLAADGSACGTYGWLGSTAGDSCLAAQGAVIPGGVILLPPCNWCAEAGTNNGGSRKGDPKYDTCLDLYSCIRRTGCGLARNGFIGVCLCGDASIGTCTGAGPCGAEELAALESASDPASVQDVLAHRLTNISPALPGYCGSTLNQVIQIANTYNCFPADAGPF